MSSSQFNTLIHEPKRLQICAFLVSIKEAEFKMLRDRLALSDSALSKHIKSLEEASYVLLVKRAKNGRQRTWISLSADGRKAFKEHVKELKRIVG